jgi:hypothetical protein
MCFHEITERSEATQKQQQAGREASWLKKVRKVKVKRVEKMKSGRQDQGGRSKKLW